MVGVIYSRDEACTSDALLAVAHEFTPRVEVCGPREVALDLRGLTRMFGEAQVLGTTLRETVTSSGYVAAVAMAGTRTAARLLARIAASGACEPVTVIASGAEAAAVRGLPISLLSQLDDRHASDQDRACVPTFLRWGLQTLGDLAALPADAVAARLGQRGVQWQRLARGEDLTPLHPTGPVERFEQTLELDWPVEGLEPLAFVLGRVLDPLTAQLRRRGRGAVALHTRLHLVTRTVHERSVHLPAPMHDARALRTLLLLDLESHPPDAGIDRVVVSADPTPARTLQFSLLTRATPSPEHLSTLLARLSALMGETRCGSPTTVDTWQPGAVAMVQFAPPDSEAPLSQSVEPGEAERPMAMAFRRFRAPVPARVQAQHGSPRRVIVDRRGLTGGVIETCAGPWRTSGGWWQEERAAADWDRDEWEVALGNGVIYRIFQDRANGAWFIDGLVD